MKNLLQTGLTHWCHASRTYVSAAALTMSGEIARNLEAVQTRIITICQASTSRSSSLPPPRLVAVSKTKPVEVLAEALSAGQLHLGENYVAELATKAADPRLANARWHFIGHCQTNKLAKLLATPNLWLVETVHSTKMAVDMQRRWSALAGTVARPAGCDARLDVLLQVNTSAEPQKSGVSPDEVVALAQLVVAECPALRLRGLMTIGSVVGAGGAEFEQLVTCRRAVAGALQLADEDELELSMGMSGDLESAVELGSTNVRVGSSIFGARQYPAAAANATPS